MRECYRILEIEPAASLEEVKRAYRELAKGCHPDRFAHDPKLRQEAQEKLNRITFAYQRICSCGPITPASGPITPSGSATAPRNKAPPPPPRPSFGAKVVRFILIGAGATTALSAIVNIVGAFELIEKSDAESLGITRNEIVGWYGALLAAGLGMIYFGLRRRK